MLDCPGTFEQAFENVPFLSLVIHLEEHLFFGILKMQWANTQRHFRFTLLEEGFVMVLMKDSEFYG